MRSAKKRYVFKIAFLFRGVQARSVLASRRNERRREKKNLARAIVAIHPLASSGRARTSERGKREMMPGEPSGRGAGDDEGAVVLLFGGVGKTLKRETRASIPHAVSTDAARTRNRQMSFPANKNSVERLEAFD